jgi:transposase
LLSVTESDLEIGGMVMVALGHIGGERAAAFQRRVAGLDPDRVLLVGIDVAKPTWFVLGCTLTGEVVLEGRRLPATRVGLVELLDAIDEVRAGLRAQLVVVGVEAAGHLHRTLVGHLREVVGLEVRVLNPASVAEERKKQLNRRRKTDALDAAACCQLLRNGGGTIALVDHEPVLTLRTLWAGRKDLVEARARLRQQMHTLIDQLWPGLTARDDEAGVRPLLHDLLDTKAGQVIVSLLAEGWTPQDFAGADIEDLQRRFAGRGCRLQRPLAARIRAFAASSLPPHPSATAGAQAMLAQLWDTFVSLSARIGELEEQLAVELAHTQGAKLTQIPGIATVTAAGVVAFIGDVARWDHWASVWRAVGLDPARAQSGDTDPELGISREGSAWGRHALLDAVVCTVRVPGRWRDTYLRRRDAKKPKKVAVIATGNGLGRTMFAMMATGDDYDPDHETTRRRRKQEVTMAA